MGKRPAYLGGEGAWRALRVVAKGPFRPTAAAPLPGGGVLLVERAFDPDTGVRVRVSEVAADQFEPAWLDRGLPIQPRELAVLEPPMPIDNIEAADVQVGPRGETLVYLLADDNFSSDQKNLLLQLELRDVKGAP